jgi:VIT1/CCC1 family predicted Fe2+/Mn2+ transporter
MSGAFSTSRWKWTWWSLLLCCASVLVFLLAGVLAGLFPSLGGDGGPAYYVAVLGLAGLAMGIIGAVVTFVMTMLHRHSPPAKPVA